MQIDTPRLPSPDQVQPVGQTSPGTRPHGITPWVPGPASLAASAPPGPAHTSLAGLTTLDPVRETLPAMPPSGR